MKDLYDQLEQQLIAIMRKDFDSDSYEQVFWEYLNFSKEEHDKKINGIHASNALRSLFNSRLHWEDIK